MVDFKRPLFFLGRIVATPGALAALEEAQQAPAVFLDRHVLGDWGDCGKDDAALNDAAVTEGTRILSVYRTARDVKIWIITEADRSSTCILLPDEY